jgi:hypothetical protein
MKLVCAAIHDQKVGAFMQPFFVRSRGEAMRTFVDAVHDSNSPFGKHPEDFVLFLLAEYDDGDGSFSSATPPPVLLSALDALNLK